jgi:hypothetical protein
MRTCLGPVVQPQHREYDPLEPGRQQEAALAVAVLHPARAGRVGAGNAAQGRAERPGQLRRGAGHLDPARTGMGAGDLRAVTGQDLAYPVDVGRIGAVGARQLFGGYRGRPGHQFGGQLGPAPGNQCHLDPFALVNRPDVLDAGNRLALAAG